MGLQRRGLEGLTKEDLERLKNWAPAIASKSECKQKKCFLSFSVHYNCAVGKYVVGFERDDDDVGK